MSRRQLTLRVASTDVARAETLLELAGAEVVSLADAADSPLFEPLPDETPLWPTVTVRALFPAGADLEALCSMLRADCTLLGDIEIASLADSTWLDAARQQFAARRFGARLWLSPPDASPAPPGLTTVLLHMGLAFGTGEHPTTALCLEWLDAHLESGATVLDYGCGSGVLAIAALALGASGAWAVDHDAQALSSTADNALLNGVTDRIVVLAPEALPLIVVDTVLANILAAPLVELAPRFAEHVRPRGTIALSGILERQVERVAAAYEPYFDDFAATVQNGWARLDAVRRNSS
ncbi:MAG TPA: 50S ribosomal protein L11 methyltransferase [Gammaproteobacteria bacterium]|nr:50S ribosomal protein L11 methyltransferase [Gammaproteobacteria bacterium]